MPALLELGQLPAPLLWQARSSACIGQPAWAGSAAAAGCGQEDGNGSGWEGNSHGGKRKSRKGFW